MIGKGDDGAQPLDADTALHAIDALARLPALTSLVLQPCELDETVVRLLALAEGGGLQRLAKLQIWNFQPGWTVGAMLLLLLWLKREAKKALQDEG